ncbi:hypothetical protein FOQG_00609 [Fusarium oxysporum f. sp. raphani 54005]|uniref:Uncharacterized protein n=3 Tax=Fusarium oxysporum TaxID=5507 RepID=X0DBB7_FUSOX|nr:hypothetical protein FOVG_02968 [Fusarium oxysporum f. sp. pisi HDV247]EXL00425.1 hypothetical protein FOQG_00609 [Fusarium oxysporum f. sp. raphani 54005]EXL85946.1 hypothetical protein FOPG_02210 [Fusarium oxysporum f. sp. conglutinans race 2 54008]KAI8415010.1 hypothetical protein FOFC_04630 [Fusarium oxysporum]
MRLLYLEDQKGCHRYDALTEEAPYYGYRPVQSPVAEKEKKVEY